MTKSARQGRQCNRPGAGDKPWDRKGPLTAEQRWATPWRAAGCGFHYQFLSSGLSARLDFDVFLHAALAQDGRGCGSSAQPGRAFVEELSEKNSVKAGLPGGGSPVSSRRGAVTVTGALF